MIAQRVAERMDGLVLPATPLGVTPMHMPFEGTITLTPDTYMRVVIETCASTAKHGARYLMLDRTGTRATFPRSPSPPKRSTATHGMTVLTVQACYVAEELYGGSCNGLTHGGEIEALAVLAHRPELVHLDRIEYSSDHSHGHKMDKLRRTRSYQPVLTDIRSIAPTGWFGSPQHATAEKGHAHGRRHRRRHRHARPPPFSVSSMRCRAAAPRLKQLQAGGLMARLLKQSEAKRLGLPGRTSLEPVSGEIGSRVTFRIAEIPVPQAGDQPRGPHLHREFEECIYVLVGEGTTVAESGEIAVKPGDIVLIPPGEKHMTRNTGSVPLVLLCFFPVPDVTAGPRNSRVFEISMASDVLCLRPEADFARVDALPPASLRVSYAQARRPGAGATREGVGRPRHSRRRPEARSRPVRGPPPEPRPDHRRGRRSARRGRAHTPRHSGRQCSRREQQCGRRIRRDSGLDAAASPRLGG